MNRETFRTSRRVMLLSGSLFLLGIALLAFSVMAFNSVSSLKFDIKDASAFLPHRKLLHGGSPVYQPNRIKGDSCTTEDIIINQGPGTPLPNGIPTYTVEITNVCVTGCDISDIHLTCGWFTMAQLINPDVFDRVRYNDCLVNAGNPLVNGDTLSFQYATSRPYSFSVSSMVCG